MSSANNQMSNAPAADITVPPSTGVGSGPVIDEVPTSALRSNPVLEQIIPATTQPSLSQPSNQRVIYSNSRFVPQYGLPPNYVPPVTAHRGIGITLTNTIGQTVVSLSQPQISSALVFSNNVNSYKPVESILIGCGNSGNYVVENRNWTGDVNTIYTPIETPKISSVPVQAPRHSATVDPNWYGTARLSHSEFTYSFPVTDGQKFIRLYFYPASYPNFDRSNSLFSVKAGPYTLLKDFNASLTADNDDDDQDTVSREYCLNVEPGQRLNITFIPNPSHSEAYAFINAIEVVSMPTDLYYTKPFGRQIQIVGQNNEFFSVGNYTALEMMYRIDVGGAQAIPADSDTGMFRNWEPDKSYLKQEHDKSLPTNLSAKLNYTEEVPNYTAPDQVYLTARSYGQYEKSRFNVTWEFEVDAGFNYMVRLHFCEVESNILNTGDRVFQIFIADMMAENHADVIMWSGGNLHPIYNDYGVVSFISGNLKKPNLTIKLQQHPDESITVHPDVILNGIEIFKLSNMNNNNLGAPNPDPRPSPPPPPPQLTQPSKNSNNKKTVLVVTIAGAISGFLILSAVISLLIIFRRRSRAQGTGNGRGQGSVKGSKSSKGHGSSSLPSHLCRYFSIAEIIAATGNFDANFIVGLGGFGNVYKGYIDDGTTPVAIKRLKPGSQQGAIEFQTEIEMLSQLRHLHLVSLIGFCNDGNEMILVYDFMQRGTLRDHLYDSDNEPLSWKQRLEILLGAARGLHYLHTGAKHNIIHRDVKTTNILLDEKWVAKVSDFGLSKVGPTGISQSHVSTVVKGSLGYLDPEYYKRQRLTQKSDVYSFGVVLLEVLCGRPPTLRTVEKHRVSLVEWVRKCHHDGEIDQTVDPFLRGSIKPQCLKTFSKMALSCLHDDGSERPSMSDVVGALEFALQLQGSDEIEENILGGTHEEGKTEGRPLLPQFISDEERDVVFTSTEESGSKSSKVTITTTTSSEDQALFSAAVFSEIRDPRAR